MLIAQTNAKAMKTIRYTYRKLCGLVLLAALFCPAAAAGTDRHATELLERLAASVREMGTYSVLFEVLAGDHAYDGRYDVRGDAYYMTVNGAEVYSDGRTRYEVNPEHREVVVDAVDTSSRNLLNNPTRAFDFLDGQFAAEYLGERPEGDVVRLTPLERHAAVGMIEVCIDPRSALPRSVVYEIDGDHVTIRVHGIAPGKEPPRAFDAAAYAGYEFIDFR